MYGKNKNLDIYFLIFNLLQNFKSIHARHIDIQQQNIRYLLF